MLLENSNALEEIKRLKAEMERSVIGQDYVVERLLIALVANGNVLLEGLPCLAKTRSAKSLAKTLEDRKRNSFKTKSDFIRNEYR